MQRGKKSTVKLLNDLECAVEFKANKHWQIISIEGEREGESEWEVQRWKKWHDIINCEKNPICQFEAIIFTPQNTQLKAVHTRFDWVFVDRQKRTILNWIDIYAVFGLFNALFIHRN